MHQNQNSSKVYQIVFAFLHAIEAHVDAWNVNNLVLAFKDGDGGAERSRWVKLFKISTLMTDNLLKMYISNIAMVQRTFLHDIKKIRPRKVCKSTCHTFRCSQNAGWKILEIEKMHWNVSNVWNMYDISMIDMYPSSGMRVQGRNIEIHRIWIISCCHVCVRDKCTHAPWLAFSFYRITTILSKIVVLQLHRINL